ncbi:glycosyltransferase family 2 protein [Cyanobium sp. NIES-981]|uniref:glycosyltransferase family 2 protein n=1 Tax=Cyanobium sp. NIES-981 TaxID=1851505 RepID=UPI0007DD063C|nr:glycosyltransferase family 2 protein [Cyanobium sp. NIES-981]SBO44033.1 putative Glycosyltransferase [Cyanobium sp. NIES-981]
MQPPSPPHQRRIWFSLVLFQHRLPSIQPLLASIRALAEQTPRWRTALAVYDGSPPGPALPAAAELEAQLGGVPLHYTRGANVGYGRAHNSNYAAAALDPGDLFIVTNPDIRFAPAELTPLLDWVVCSPQVSCAAPLVVGDDGAIQYSAKHNPTLLALALGRFPLLKAVPGFRRYDRFHRNAFRDYSSECFPSAFLSGCFLVIPAHSYGAVGGFCERYFLHLEDADLVRRLSSIGLTVHNPKGRVVHSWARGSHRSVRQMLCLLKSMLIYRSIWGLRFA